MARVRVRQIWFQFHKWIGLLLGIVLLALGVSGSVLLAHDWLEEGAPKPAHAAPPPLPLPPSRYLAAAADALPRGARPTQLIFPAAAGDPVQVRGFAAGRGPASVTLDAATATPRPADGAAAFFGVMHRLHGSLLIPGVGRQVVGWLGVAMLISSLSGLWLWWPKWAFRRGLRWQRTPAFDGNLHHMVGFWIALPLGLLSLTGAWIAFPAFFGAIVGEAAPRRPAFAAGRDAPPPRLAIDVATARLAGGGALRDLSLPNGKPALWIATRADGSRIAIDDASGAIVPAPDRPRAGPIMQAMRALHEGAGSTGPIWRAIVLLGGIAPAVLAITGIIMWLRTRGWRGDVAARKRDRAAAG